VLSGTLPPGQHRRNGKPPGICQTFDQGSSAAAPGDRRHTTTRPAVTGFAGQLRGCPAPTPALLSLGNALANRAPPPRGTPKWFRGLGRGSRVNWRRTSGIPTIHRRLVLPRPRRRDPAWGQRGGTHATRGNLLWGAFPSRRGRRPHGQGLQVEGLAPGWPRDSALCGTRACRTPCTHQPGDRRGVAEHQAAADDTKPPEGRTPRPSVHGYRPGAADATKPWQQRSPPRSCRRLTSWFLRGFPGSQGLPWP
jgi:hypothetical protein